MVLACLPCLDHDSVFTADKFHVINDILFTEGHYHNDFCSPLCVCSCCSTVVEVINNSTDIKMPIDDQNIQYSYSKDFFSLFYSAIWQPPKIS